MNRTDAKILADDITNQELHTMFKNAKNNITNWDEASSVNKSMTKGSAWNILAKNFDVTTNYHVLTKTNMIREFAEYLPEHLQPPKKKVRENIKTHHQEPNFINY